MFKIMSSVFDKISKKVSRGFQVCFYEVLSCNFGVARISSQLPKQNESVHGNRIRVLWSVSFEKYALCTESF